MSLQRNPMVTASGLEKKKMTVHLLTIENHHGADHWVCDTGVTALAYLDEYVQRWWLREMKTDMPSDANSRIEQYFLEMVEQGGRESYTIEVLPILAGVTA